jgi:predicted enzyme involved in methoxymalonyl-ACP biosynthesis
MSCRVLERQVEEEVINEIIRLARLKRGEKVLGIYLPTAKNGMVRDLYPRMGFELLQESGERLEFIRYLLDYREKKTKIGIIRRAYE